MSDPFVNSLFAKGLAKPGEMVVPLYLEEHFAGSLHLPYEAVRDAVASALQSRHGEVIEGVQGRTGIPRKELVAAISASAVSNSDCSTNRSTRSRNQPNSTQRYRIDFLDIQWERADSGLF